ncbi:hypothetical protein SG34_033715 [Thalassomonas viridans]|uniref:Uncharacterized protein n=1 Tax=Thalassomonas viridans TaxID=137584 RepID=A0AAE9ZEN6_9GAMM|nr:hypothetical protein [Thalassomonas viridans]WDE08852.1 hypothetical protein SG34_033715 [Thalassomonas viridans]
MATFNDMPELHSVKVFVTENTLTRRRHPSVTVGTTFTSCFISGSINKDFSLPLEGGQAYV